MNSLVRRLAVRYPIIQAPMAGVSTRALAAAVSDAGGLGSVAIGHLNHDAAQNAIAAVRELVKGPFNVNVFCHRPALRDAANERKWLERLAPFFHRYHATPPASLNEVYRSYIAEESLQSLLLRERPAVVSCHFGLPLKQHIHSLQSQGCFVMATVTNVLEGVSAEEAGVDAVVAQGYEAGGHRGMFDPDAEDECLSTLELTNSLARNTKLPIVSAGGIMDSAGVQEVMDAGASAVQVGTAFLLCPEASVNAGYRSALRSASVRGTEMTRAISGRPARSIINEFSRFGDTIEDAKVIPSYPVAYDAGKALGAAAAACENHEFGAHWAGTGASRCVPVSAREVMDRLTADLLT